MDGNYTRGVKSTASIAGHPIHPMIVPFPIAFLVGALFTDIAFLWTGDPFWARASLNLVVGGFAMGVLAALFGLTDFLTIRKVREHTEAWIHFLANVTALALALVRALVSWDDPAGTVLPWGVILSLLIVGNLGLSGWMGGELAYRHKIGVLEDEKPGQ